jgi:hypothetical protein
MKLRGIRRIALALVLGMGAITAFWGAGQHSVASAPAQHRLAGDAMPPIPQAQVVSPAWGWWTK